MSATHYDAALAWLDVAAGAVENARECMAIGALSAHTSIEARKAAHRADMALRDALNDIVADEYAVTIARLIRDRLSAERGAAQ